MVHYFHHHLSSRGFQHFNFSPDSSFGFKSFSLFRHHVVDADGVVHVVFILTAVVGPLEQLDPEGPHHTVDGATLAEDQQVGLALLGEVAEPGAKVLQHLHAGKKKMERLPVCKGVPDGLHRHGPDAAARLVHLVELGVQQAGHQGVDGVQGPLKEVGLQF